MPVLIEPTSPTHAIANGGANSALTSGRILARNAAGNLVSQCVPMAVAIVSMPWLIRGLGTDRFGVMTLAWMVLGYFSLFDLGLGRALTKMVAEKLGRSEDEEVPGLIWTAMTLMMGLGLVGTGTVTWITPWLVNDALKISGTLRDESLGAFYFMGAALPFLIGTSGLRGVMEAYQKLRTANILRTTTALAILLGPLALLPFTTDLRAAVGIVAAARLASFIGHAWLCLRVVPGMRQGSGFRRDFLRPMLGYGGWMTAVNVINPLMVQMDRFLVGALISTAAVTFYTTPYELITKGWFLSNAVLGVIFPAFATSYVQDRRRTVLIFERCLRYVAIILFPLALVSIAAGHELLTVWLGADFARQSTQVMQWLALGVLLNGLAQVPSALLQGVGRPDITFKIHLAELPPYLLAAWVLTLRYGITGTAMAWAGRTALDLALYFAVVGKILPGGGEVVRRALRGLAPALALLLAAALPFGPVYRATVLAVGSVIYLMMAWGKLLTAHERSLILGRIAPAWSGTGVMLVRDASDEGKA